MSDLAHLERRLAHLEAKEAASACLMRYMDLCDVPGDATREAFETLFTEDAVWEGIGRHYEGKFGKVTGRAAVIGLVTGYLPPVDHFKANAHVVASEQLTVTPGVPPTTVNGRWLMQQLSLYTDGRADLLCSRITVEFALTWGPETVEAQMRHFGTQQLFAAELDASQFAATLSAQREESR